MINLNTLCMMIIFLNSLYWLFLMLIVIKLVLGCGKHWLLIILILIDYIQKWWWTLTASTFSKSKSFKQQIDCPLVNCLFTNIQTPTEWTKQNMLKQQTYYDCLEFEILIIVYVRCVCVCVCVCVCDNSLDNSTIDN